MACILHRNNSHTHSERQRSLSAVMNSHLPPLHPYALSATRPAVQVHPREPMANDKGMARASPPGLPADGVWRRLRFAVLERVILPVALPFLRAWLRLCRCTIDNAALLEPGCAPDRMVLAAWHGSMFHLLACLLALRKGSTLPPADLRPASVLRAARRWLASGRSRGRLQRRRANASHAVRYKDLRPASVLRAARRWLASGRGRGRRQRLPPRRIVVLLSASLDGRLLARFLQAFGIGHVFGAAGEDGVRGARHAVRCVRTGALAVIAVDGPSGPAGVVKPGIGLVARIADADVIVARTWAGGGFRFPSWDRCHVPWPFVRVHAVLQRMPPPRQEDLADFRLRVERLLAGEDGVRLAAGVRGSTPSSGDAPRTTAPGGAR